MSLFGIIIIVLAIYLVWRLVSNQRENYGPVKNIKHIPLGECTNICQQYYQKCLADDVHGVNTGWCEMRFGEACKAECTYSNYHRV